MGEWWAEGDRIPPVSQWDRTESSNGIFNLSPELSPSVMAFHGAPCALVDVGQPHGVAFLPVATGRHLISFHCFDIIAFRNWQESNVAAVVVRSLPDETLRALKQRAAKSGRSTEAEIREILSNAVRSPFGMGSALARIGQQFGGVDLKPGVKKSTARPARFS